MNPMASPVDRVIAPCARPTLTRFNTFATSQKISQAAARALEPAARAQVQSSVYGQPDAITVVSHEEHHRRGALSTPESGNCCPR